PIFWLHRIPNSRRQKRLLENTSLREAATLGPWSRDAKASGDAAMTPPGCLQCQLAVRQAALLGQDGDQSLGDRAQLRRGRAQGVGDLVGMPALDTSPAAAATA